MSKSRVFIIESLKFIDEKNKQFEGEILSQILHLGEKGSKYYYFRTERELRVLLRKFNRSKYRYLHLSCHGTEELIVTTLDKVIFTDFAKIAKTYLKDKRLFISACELVNDDFADAIFPTTDCMSIIGPDTEIAFSDAAIMWASFYHLAFSIEPYRMTRESAEKALQKVVNTFETPLNFYTRNRSRKKGYEPIPIRPKN